MTTDEGAGPHAGEDCDRLQVSVFGKLLLVYRGGPASPLGRKAQALVGYLMLSDTPSATRERLRSLLWSGSGEKQAGVSLRQALTELRSLLRDIEFTGLATDNHSVEIDRSRLEVDLWDALQASRSGVVHPALLNRAQVTDTLLEGLDSVDPAFGVWLRDTRAAICEQLVVNLSQALPTDDAHPVSEAAEAAARAIAQLDPGHEASTRTIIRARWAAGDIATALGTYQRLWRLMDEEFDAEPSPETQNLVAKLRLEQPEASAPLPLLLGQDSSGIRMPGGYEARPSIAVLPFQTLGPADQQYFGDGIVDDIIQSLAGLRDLFVISKGSTRNYRDAIPDLQVIARTLGVRYVLHGSVQRSGESLRIHTVLADADTAEVLRPRRYDGKISDLFDLQDQIARETTKFIAPYVREQELRRAARKRPQNLTAYDLVLQALGPLHDLDYASFSRARGLLQRAIEQDLTYAPAYASLAHWHCYRIGQMWSTDILADMREADRLAALSIKLDQNNATALAVHAHVKCVVNRDYEASRALFRRALTESPNSAFAWTMSAVTESCAGCGEDGVLHAQTAIRLSPGDNFSHYPYFVLAQSHFVAGAFAEAVRFGRLAFDRNAQFAANLRILAASLVETGQLDEARAIVEHHLSLVPNFSVRRWSDRTWLSAAARDKIAKDLRQVGMPD